MKTENNKLIAEFMNWDSNESKTVFYEPTDEVQGIDGFTLENLPFDNWNWLMKVVEKIESLENHGFTIYRKTTNINGLPIELANTKKATKIEAVYNACIGFIKWYNQQKK